MNQGQYLLFRAWGATWGLPTWAVTAVDRGKRLEIRVGEATLTADEVLGITEQLEVYPAGKLLAVFWPYSCLGLAVAGQEPLVVLKPSHVPPVLCKGEP